MIKIGDRVRKLDGTNIGAEGLVTSVGTGSWVDAKDGLTFETDFGNEIWCYADSDWCELVDTSASEEAK